MKLTRNSASVRQAEQMVLREMEPNGHITVRSLDKIHAQTGLAYVLVSEIARRVAKGMIHTEAAV